MNRRLLPLAGLAVLLLVSSCNYEQTYGREWQGDSDKCISVKPDTIIQTIGGDVGGLQQEFGVETPSYTGQPGCEFAYVTDYLMPSLSENINPGWSWAWIHIASRLDPIDESLCNTLWTSVKVYTYWEFQGNHYEELKLESYRRAEWNGFACLFGYPDSLGISSRWDRIRVVSQHGGGSIALQPHYSYFVTDTGPP